jgi:hypothetical protein
MPSKNWQQMEFQPVINTSYVTADGEQTWLDVDFAACTNEYEAQRHAILLSRRGRNATDCDDSRGNVCLQDSSV